MVLESVRQKKPCREPHSGQTALGTRTEHDGQGPAAWSPESAQWRFLSSHLAEGGFAFPLTSPCRPWLKRRPASTETDESTAEPVGLGGRQEHGSSRGPLTVSSTQHRRSQSPTQAHHFPQTRRRVHLHAGREQLAPASHTSSRKQGY